MRIGILTSWRVPCGIYQYSARYADALEQIGHGPVILAGRADEHRSVPEESTHSVFNVAKIGLWRDDQQYNLDIDWITRLGLDAIHVQYQSMLFSQQALAEMCMAYSGPVAITYHDNCQRGDFPYHSFSNHFTHRRNVGPPQAKVIPFGIEVRPPIVRTFGLGRTRSDIIGSICNNNGWVFEDIATHEPIHGGGQRWRSHDELIEWLRGADVIVLWYDDVAQAGSSQAARTALASCRPVVTNDTTWFSDLPASISNHHYNKVHNVIELEDTLFDILHPHHYVRTHSWTTVAKLMVDEFMISSTSTVAN